MPDELIVAPAPRRTSLVERVAQRYEVEPEKLLATMKATCFKTDKAISNEQMMSLLIVAEQYHLNPFTKELFAFDDKRGGIVPFVSVDGWSRIINEHAQYDGAEFHWDEVQKSITCTLHRKDRSHPTVVTEYMDECKRGTAPWQSHPRRMLRHKALIQCARLAFGFAGIYDEDEAQRIRDIGQSQVTLPSTQRSALQRVLTTTQAHFEAPDVVATAAPVEEALASSLTELTVEMLSCGEDRDAAAEVLDRGRSILPMEEYSELAATFASVYDQENAQ